MTAGYSWIGHPDFYQWWSLIKFECCSGLQNIVIAKCTLAAANIWAVNVHFAVKALVFFCRALQKQEVVLQQQSILWNNNNASYFCSDKYRYMHATGKQHTSGSDTMGCFCRACQFATKFCTATKMQSMFAAANLCLHTVQVCSINNQILQSQLTNCGPNCLWYTSGF